MKNITLDATETRTPRLQTSTVHYWEPSEWGNPYNGHHKYENKHQIGVHYCTELSHSGINHGNFKGHCISEAIAVGSESLQSCLRSWGLVFPALRWTQGLLTMKKYLIHTVPSTWKRLWRLVRYLCYLYIRIVCEKKSIAKKQTPLGSFFSYQHF